MIVAFVLALLLAGQDPGATVRGLVRSEATGQPLTGAVVEIRSEAATRSVLTGSGGTYTLREVAAGRRLVRASFLGYETLEVELTVAPGAEVNLDLSLRLRPVALEEIVVVGTLASGLADTSRLNSPELGVVGLRAIQAATPGIAELGLGDAYRGSPGQGPIDPSDVLYVRGAPADLKLVLLDGAPVYTPFHVAGLLESFEADVLHSATLHLGGAPARYDGGLSYVMELATRSGREGRLRSSGSLDLMSTRATIDGSLGDRVRYLAAGRHVHGLGIRPLGDGGFPYSYGEGLARIDAAVGRHGGLSLTAFRNDEGVAIDSLHATRRNAGWGNSAVSLRYRGRVGENALELGTAYGGFEAALPIALGDGFPSWGRTERFRLTADVARAGDHFAFRYGGSFDHLNLRHEVRTGLGSEDSWSSATYGRSGGVYAEGSWQVAPRLQLRGGARADLFLAQPELRIAPRLSATWMVGERAALTAAAGRYHQYVRRVSVHALLTPGGGRDTVLLASGLTVGEANHFNLSLLQELDDDLRLGIEGFFKSFERNEALIDPGYSSGVDLWVRRDSGRYRGWLGYSLSWVWSVGSVNGASESFAGRQLLNAGISGPIGRLVELDARVSYGSGLPFTAIPLDVANANLGESFTGRSNVVPLQGQTATDTPLLPGAPADTYLRLDLGISRGFRTAVTGRPMGFAPYVRILNSLDRRDGIFYWDDRRNEEGPRPVAALPVVPIIGVSWVF